MGLTRRGSSRRIAATGTEALPRIACSTRRPQVGAGALYDVSQTTELETAYSITKINTNRNVFMRGAEARSINVYSLRRGVLGGRARRPAVGRLGHVFVGTLDGRGVIPSPGYARAGLRRDPIWGQRPETSSASRTITIYEEPSPFLTNAECPLTYDRCARGALMTSERTKELANKWLQPTARWCILSAPRLNHGR
jgi:hypothetical protein